MSNSTKILKSCHKANYLLVLIIFYFIFKNLSYLVKYYFYLNNFKQVFNLIKNIIHRECLLFQKINIQSNTRYNKKILYIEIQLVSY